MRDAVGLPNPCSKGRQTHSPCFTKNTEETALTSKMLLELFKHLLLLLAEMKRVKSPLIAIANVELREEPLNVI